MPQLYHIVLFQSPTRRRLMTIDGIPFLKRPYTSFVIVDSTYCRQAADTTINIWMKIEAIDQFQEIWEEASNPDRRGSKFSIMNALVHEQQHLLERAIRTQELIVEQHFSQVKLGRTLAKP